MGLIAGMLADAPAASGAVHSVWDFCVKGGPTIGVIFVCSLIALAIIIERFFVTRRRAVIPADFVAGLAAIGPDPQRELDFCRANGSPIANIVAAAVQRRGEPRESLERAVADAGKRELVVLRKRVRLLGALPQVATMLGLLGTVFGMIKTFQAVAVSAQALGKTEMLARGIFEAWANTAAGLLVAIPVLVLYHVLLGRIETRAVDMDRVAVDWIDQQLRPATVLKLAEAPRETLVTHAAPLPAAAPAAH